MIMESRRIGAFFEEDDGFGSNPSDVSHLQFSCFFSLDIWIDKSCDEKAVNEKYQVIVIEKFREKLEDKTHYHETHPHVNQRVLLPLFPQRVYQCRNAKKEIKDPKRKTGFIRWQNAGRY